MISNFQRLADGAPRVAAHAQLSSYISNFAVASERREFTTGQRIGGLLARIPEYEADVAQVRRQQISALDGTGYMTSG